MQVLNTLSFTDIILLPDGRGKLKGTPGYGSKLVDLPQSISTETLFGRIKGMMHEKKQTKFRITIDKTIYRVAVYEDINLATTAFLRRLPDTVPDFTSLGIPSPLDIWLLQERHKKGLVLFAGAQGSGKTTSAASYIQARIAKNGGHMVSFECPVEMPLAGQCGEHGYCFQGDIDEDKLAQNIKLSHRFASPDILYVGEIIGPDTASQALRAALGSSQQVVVSSIHGLSVIAALDRLLTWAKEIEGNEGANNLLASSLFAVIFQEIKEEEGKKCLHVPEYLFIPFTTGGDSTRAAIRDGNLRSLQNDMNALQNRIIISHDKAI